MPWVISARDMLGVSFEPYPNLEAWLARLGERPSVAAEIAIVAAAVSDIGREELERRLGEDGLVVLDVRTAGEYAGEAGYPCDHRQGHLPGARNVELQELLEAGDAGEIRALVGVPAGTEVIAYCHSGGRSGMAAQILRAAGYEARNYAGSWHEWSADPQLPVE